MDAIETLVAEHRNIERVLAVLEPVAERGATRAKLREIVHLLRRYADALHHAKEEDVLFRAMMDAGMPDDEGPLAVMLAHHEEGRRLVGEIAELADAGDAPLSESETRTLARAGRDFVTLLRIHIQEEDAILYPMARERVRPARMDEVDSDCAGIDRARATEIADLVARIGALDAS